MVCKVCNRECDPVKSAHPADVQREPHKYCPNCWMPLPEAEEMSQEDLEAAGQMFDSLQAGTFYEEQDKACREMFGHGVEFMPKGEK